MNRISGFFIFLEILIPIWALTGDLFLAENVKLAKLENQKLAEKIQQRLKENDIQQLLKNLTDEETERFRHETEVRPNIKGSPDPSHFSFEINVGKRRIRHRTTPNLNDLKFVRF